MCRSANHAWGVRGGLFLLAGLGPVIGLSQAIEPVYVSIVMHNEEPGGANPNFVGSPPAFVQHRTALVAFADMLYANGAMFNWQSDWNFLQAVAIYDSGTPSTNGKNVVRYLKEDLGFEVDPHAHETPGNYNYADVAYLIDSLGVTPSKTVGGMVVFPPADSILEYFRSPILGWQYTYSWQAEILWGGGTDHHVDEDHLRASGVYRPTDNSHFLIHDDDAPLPVVGKYNSSWVGLNALLTKQQGGELEDGRIHTCTIAVSQVQLVDDLSFVATFESALQSFDAAGDLRWVGLAEVIDIWQVLYGSQPNILRWLTFGDWNKDNDVDGDDYTNFVSCMTGSDPLGGVTDPDCYVFDFEPDDDVDCDDWDQFVLAWTEPGDPPAAPASCSAAIPAVSDWGFVAMTLLVLTTGTVVLARRRTNVAL